MSLSKEEQKKREEQIKKSDLAIEKLNNPDLLKERRRSSVLNDLDLDEETVEDNESPLYKKTGLPSSVDVPKNSNPNNS